jgi:hypothetical protein
MAASPFPDSPSSLSKYIPLEDHYKLLRSIKNDTTLDSLKATFQDHLVVTARKRYFTEVGGVVRRDKLIDLIQEEGKFTDRVKMVMYFLFMFRDSRYRDFICKDVAGKDGRWDIGAFKTARQDMFPQAGGRKAFTNLRQLLVGANLLTSTFAVKPFPALDLWFVDAVEISATHITDPIAQQAFVSSPQAFLIKYKLQGLLNTTAQDLAKVDVQNISDESPDLLPVYPLPAKASTLINPNFKSWDRTAPLKKNQLSPAVIQSNPALLERASGQHFLLENMMKKACTDAGHDAKYNMHIDLFIETKTGSLLFEMKSCSLGNTRTQIRRAVSQVFEYPYIYRDELSKPIQRCIVVERKPRGPNEWLIKYVEFLEIGLVWRRDSSEEFGCTRTTMKWLCPFLIEAKNWIL